ncbi:MAG: hypothetical protein K9J85_09530 [Desulfobacteraceae bacterium]|nr:hypothetical protein [Desulfobacteraceae bacterium]
MKSNTAPRIKRCIAGIRFFAIKLPCVYLLIIMGFVLEFLITLPFIIITEADSLRKNNSHESRRDSKKV